MSQRSSDLKAERSRAEAIVYACILFTHLGSAVLSGGSAYLFFDHQETSGATALLVAVLVGGMTYAALHAFSAVAVRILPRVARTQAMAAGIVCAIGLLAILAISGTSNATFLAYGEAKAVERQETLAGAEGAFAAVQTTTHQLEQVLPILATGRQTATNLKRHEERSGQTGAGRGPIFVELLVQETRLAGAEESVREVLKSAEAKIRAGQQTLESLRAALADGSVETRDRVRVVENALARLSAIVIELRQQLPIASLKAMADMLTTASAVPAPSNNAETRRVQEETFRRMHREFEPIGLALRRAVTELEDRSPKPVPVYRHLSPTAVVFKHAGQLAWIIALGYALDLLPYLAIGLLLLAHAQGRDDDNAPGRAEPRDVRRPGRPPRAAGSMDDSQIGHARPALLPGGRLPARARQRS